MSRGGFRPGAGRPKKSGPGQKKGQSGVAVETENLTPLDYMLKVMNDPAADRDRRDRMAIAAAPFVHNRGDGKGKKDERQERAKSAASGKFATSSPPLRAVK